MVWRKKEAKGHPSELGKGVENPYTHLVVVLVVNYALVIGSCLLVRCSVAPPKNFPVILMEGSMTKDHIKMWVDGSQSNHNESMSWTLNHTLMMQILRLLIKV